MFRYSSRFWLYAPIAAFLAVAVAVMAHWHFAAQAFEQKLARLKGHDAVPGVTLDWDAVTVGGFPFRLEASFTNLSARGAGAHGPFYWQSERFAAHSLTYGRATTVYEASGRQRLRWADAQGTDHEAEFIPGKLHASSTTTANGLARFDLDVTDAGTADFTAQRLQFHLRRDPDGADLDLMVSADALHIAEKLPPHIEAYITLTKAAPLMPLLAGNAFWPDAVRDWHGKGGEVHVTKGAAPDAVFRVLSALY